MRSRFTTYPAHGLKTFTIPEFNTKTCCFTFAACSPKGGAFSQLMKIKNNSVVSFHYKLSNNEGEVLDSSEGRDAFTYLQGAQMIVPGLESQMEGKSEGEKFTAVIPPENGYGVVEPQLIQRVPKDRFGDQKVEAGMQFQAGEHSVVTVREVTDSDVVVDGNHPLAGVTLNFAVEVTGVRDATEEELAHGHVHGEGGHAH